MCNSSHSADQMVFSRGSRDDYDRYARLTGDDGWSWDNLAPFIRKVDRMTPPTDLHDTTGQFDPTIHYNGAVLYRTPLLIR